MLLSCVILSDIAQFIVYSMVLTNDRFLQNKCYKQQDWHKPVCEVVGGFKINSVINLWISDISPGPFNCPLRQVKMPIFSSGYTVANAWKPSMSPAWRTVRYPVTIVKVQERNFCFEKVVFNFPPLPFPPPFFPPFPPLRVVQILNTEKITKCIISIELRHWFILC